MRVGRPKDLLGYLDDWGFYPTRAGVVKVFAYRLRRVAARMGEFGMISADFAIFLRILTVVQTILASLQTIFTFVQVILTSLQTILTSLQPIFTFAQTIL